MNLEPEDVYGTGIGQARSGWTSLKRDAGLIVAKPGPEEAYFRRHFSALLQVEDPRRRDVMTAVVSGQEGSPGLDAEWVFRSIVTDDSGAS